MKEKSANIEAFRKSAVANRLIRFLFKKGHSTNSLDEANLIIEKTSEEILSASKIKIMKGNEYIFLEGNDFLPFVNLKIKRLLRDSNKQGNKVSITIFSSEKFDIEFI